MSPASIGLNVAQESPGSFVVEIAPPASRRSGGGTSTTHHVNVPPGLAEKIGGTGTTDDQFVKESFRFLLEREPNTSILRSFSIEVIGKYFPEWDGEMARRLSR
ncbi:MAG: hypothetical protein WAM97_21775 [Acidimicrobiales bacterium]|jgi:hypothetical protein